MSVTDVHEFGHHIGMSHPHDGYDSETGVDYGPADEFYFAWSGDESATIMHYLGVHNSFGRFDQDNMYRYETAGYVQWAEELLAALGEDPGDGGVAELLQQARQELDRAGQAFDAWDYLQAASSARLAYEAAARAADMLGLPAPSLSRLQAGPARSHPLFVDPIRHPEE